MTCDVGPRVARVASPFYYFLKFFKKSVSVGVRLEYTPATLATLAGCPDKLVYFYP